MKKSMKDVKDDDIDRLSDLPDDLLLRIIEFLNTKQSFQTCVLSKRWKFLWKHLTNLILQHSITDTTDSDVFCKFVSHILSGRDDSIPLHSLAFKHDDKYDEIRAEPSKTTLLDVLGYAVSHNVQQLSVIAPLNRIGDLELPYSSIFNCHSLTFLRLGFCHGCRSNRTMFPKSLNLPSLKTLHLQYLTFTTSDNGVAEPFSACNMLNTLVIMMCYLQDDAHALCISNSKVSSLTINTTYHLDVEEGHNYEVFFCTPKLTSLTTTGHPSFKAPSAQNLPFIEEVKIDYFYLVGPGEYEFMISFLKLLVNVKIMTLCFEALEYIEHALRHMARSRGTQPPCFVGLKSLKVEFTINNRVKASNKKVREMAKYVLQNSPPARVDIVRHLQKKKNYLRMEFQLCSKS